MKAAVLKGIGVLKVEDVPEPHPAPDEIKVKIAYCGICGTDPEILEGRFVPPEWTESTIKIPGHEASGTIVAVGDRVKKYSVGQRVACNFRSPCGACYYCRSGLENFCESPIPTGGAFAEYSVYKESAIYPLPDSVSLEVGAFLEPTSIAVHIVDLANISPGASVAIMGAGPIGLLALQLAIRAGAIKVLVSEPVAEKRQLAKKLGATVTVDPLTEDLTVVSKKLTAGRGFRSVIEASGKTAVARQAVSLADYGGTVVWAAVYPPDGKVEVVPAYMYSHELTVRSVFLSPYCFPRALDLISAIDVKSLMTDIMALADIQRAFDIHKQGKAVKLLVKM